MRSKTGLKQYFYKNNRIMLITGTFLGICLSTLNIAIAFILQKMIDIGASGNQEDLKNIIMVSALFLAIYFTFGILAGIAKNRFKEKALLNYKNEALQRLIFKNLKQFRNHSTGNYLSLFSNDLKIIETDYLEGNLTMIEQTALFICGIAAMIYIDYRVTLIIIVVGIIPLCISLYFGNRLTRLQEKISNRNAVFTSSMKDILSGITVIKSFHIEKEVLHTALDINQKLELVKKKYNILLNSVTVISSVSSFLVVMVTFVVTIWLVLRGELTLGSVMAFIQLINYLLNPINLVTGLLNKRKGSIQLLNNIDRIVLADSRESEEGKVKNTFENAIAFKDVSFSYEEGKDSVVSGINLTIEKGKSYALVGSSGSGKSTLLNLIMNYYSNYSGQICIDDLEINEIDYNCIYNLISVIQQDVYMFDDTLSNNIKLYKEYDKEELLKNIELAKLDTFVQEKGLDYSCGENGMFLSGGERQRVSIARALIKKTPIMLLDEATSALDNATANSIENTILDIRDITRIIVTHKLNEIILKKYDKIIMMKNGKIVECGSFYDLMEMKGDFYSLYHIGSDG